MLAKCINHHGIYRSLAKRGPWAVHLSLGSNWGGGGDQYSSMMSFVYNLIAFAIFTNSCSKHTIIQECCFPLSFYILFSLMYTGCIAERHCNNRRPLVQYYHITYCFFDNLCSDCINFIASLISVWMTSRMRWIRYHWL